QHTEHFDLGRAGRGGQREAASEQGCTDHCRTRGVVTLASPGAAAAAGARHPGKGYGLVRPQRRQDVHGVYELVNANQAKFPVRRMCRVLQVSASGYYDWLSRRPSRRALENSVLLEQIRDIHTESDGTYGMPRVRAELADRDVHVSRKRVAR